MQISTSATSKESLTFSPLTASNHRNTIILLVSEALITVGEKEPTGLFLVKEKLFKDLHPDTKIVRLLEYEWNSLQTDEDRLQYLKKILGF